MWWVLLALGVILLIVCCVVHTPEDTTLPWPQDVAVVIHSFDGYARYWPGSLHYWQKHTQHLTPYPKVVLATETMLPDRMPVGIHVHRTGYGTWAQRLRHVLITLSEPYVLYLQEDAWLTAPLHGAYVQRILQVMKRHQLNSLKLYAPCRHQLEHRDDVNDPLWYTVAHQPSLWRKDFLLSTLYDEQEAMAHELETNAMLHRYPELEATCRCFEDFSSYHFPFVEVSRQGQLLPVGVDMMEKLPL